MGSNAHFSLEGIKLSTENFAFYTNVSRMGNDILFIGYDHDNAPIKKKVRFSPELFIEKSSGAYQTLNGIKCDRKEFPTMGDCYEFTKQYKNVMKLYGCSDFERQFIGRTFRGQLHAQIDLMSVWFFDIETTVLNGFPDVDKVDEEITLITMINRTLKRVITWGRYAIDDPSVNSKHSQQQIQSDMQKIREMNVDYRSFSDERSLLTDFLMFCKTNRIDVLSGWNSDFFDVPYLYNRMVRVMGEDLACHISPWKRVDKKIAYVNDEEKTTYEIDGISHLDLLVLYKKFNPGSKESFSLDFIANFEVGHKKVELPGESFKDSYENYWSTFVLYNIIDTMLLLKIDEKKGLIELCADVAYMAKCNFIDVISAMRTWESMIYNYFLGLNIVEPWSKKKSTKEALEGAYVKPPKPGRYKWSISVDATSMYPSIMMQNNLSPETVVTKIDFDVERFVARQFPEIMDENVILSANGLLTRNDVQGFIPTLTRIVFDGRKDAKNEMLELKKTVKQIENEIERMNVEKRIASLNVRQNSLKVLGNALYGVCSLPHFRYYQHDIAEAITLTGQSYLKIAMDVINSTLNKILNTTGIDYCHYGDTDSIFFNVPKLVEVYCKGKSKREIVAYLEKFVVKVIQPTVNDVLSEVSRSIGAPENKMFFKLEGIAETAIWLAKKRYLMPLLYNEGVWYVDNPEYKIMGMEIVRSSTPKIIKEKLRKAVEICAEGTEEQLQEFVSECRADFMKRTVEEIAFPRGCNGIEKYSHEDTIYEKGNGVATPIAVRAALLHNHIVREKGLTDIRPISDGDKIKFVALKMPNPIHEDVIGFVGKLPEEFALNRYVDYKTQFEKGFMKPLRAVLEVIEWNEEEQVSLF